MRDLLMETFYEWSKRPYQKWFKKQQPWKHSTTDLLKLPMNSLGFHLACFLLKYDFDLQPKLEDHDVFHVLTNTGISVTDEISMQYYLLGNGKRSTYMFLVIFLGTFMYPDKYKHFRIAYRKGKTALPFYHLDFSKMLSLPLKRIRTTYLIF
ncbi:hypothetical protein ACFQ1M_00640 [Sungkyunkwania multivorans]|uniref:Coenzyme Q (Ubiquinone) biosynthesis protein Coq4 n=1 Tax=Sungkyunkwania multivorans TaxID=1173618 RepID=A0ABW3CU30_9FLAO